MHPTLRVCSERVHRPLIHFLGKRSWPTKLEPPHPHPAGPADYKAHFTDFLKKFQSSTSRSTQKKSSSPSSKSSSDHPVYEEFWEAPARLWNPRVRSLSEEEMEAVVTGGASYR